MLEKGPDPERHIEQSARLPIESIWTRCARNVSIFSGVIEGILVPSDLHSAATSEVDIRVVESDSMELVDDWVGDGRPPRGLYLPVCALLLRNGTALTTVLNEMESRDGFTWSTADLSDDGEVQRLRPSTVDDDARLQVGVRRRDSSTALWKPFLRRQGVQLSGASAPVDEEAVLVAVTCTPPDTPPRTVLWCFGSISRSLPRACTDPRFGLIVGLNKHEGGPSIPSWRTLPDDAPRRRVVGDAAARVRGVSQQVRDGYPHRASSRSAGPAPVEGLRFDSTSDLLKSLSLRTSDPLMSDLEGGRSLRFTTYLEGLTDLAVLADHLVELRALDLYKRQWDWIDHVVPVDDREEADDVLDELFDQIVGDENLGVDLLVPALPAADDTVAKRLLFAFPGESKVIRAGVTWQLTRQWLLGQVNEPGCKTLRRNLRFTAEGLSPPAEKVPLFETLVGEIDHENRHYVLSDGEILRVDKSFLDRLDSTLQQAVPWSDFPFPLYGGGTEPEYLQTAPGRSGGRLLMLDTSPIRLPGETPFEVCDLLSDDRRLVFGKLKGPSSTFSHLCTQAEVAAQLLLRTDAAREAFLERVNAATRDTAFHESALDIVLSLQSRVPDSVTITLLLLGPWRAKTLSSLPLVSRIRLRKATQQITALGYRLEIAAPDLAPLAASASARAR